MKATITIDPPDRVVQICIHLVDGDFPRVSCWPPSSKTNETRISNIPAGEYQVFASMKEAGTGKEQFSVPQMLHVIGDN